MTLAESLFILHLNKLPAIEADKILTIVDIAELVADNASVADCCINIGVRVSENPRIDTAISNEIAKFRCEGTIQQVAFMLWRNDCHCRKMMGCHHDTLGGALRNTPLDKVQTFLVLGIKVSRGKTATIVQNLPKVIHSSMHKILVLGANVRPKS